MKHWRKLIRTIREWWAAFVWSAQLWWIKWRWIALGLIAAGLLMWIVMKRKTHIANKALKAAVKHQKVLLDKSLEHHEARVSDIDREFDVIEEDREELKARMREIDKELERLDNDVDAKVQAATVIELADLWRQL